MHFHAWFLGMRRAMEMMMTGDSITGIEAVAEGWANRAFPVDQLNEQVLEIAGRIAQTPTDIAQLNKRAVHRQMEVMGIRTGIRQGTELCALGIHSETLQQFIAEIRQKGLTKKLTERDDPYGDYRTADDQPTTAGN